MVMGVSDSVTTSFPPSVIHDSDVFFLPRFMLTPSYVFTPSITSHFSFFPFSPSPPSCLIHGVRWYSDRPSLWCALHHLLPSQSPVFMSQTHQKGCNTHRFYNSHVMQSGDRGAFRGERSRLQHCTSASYFFFFFALDYIMKEWE